MITITANPANERDTQALLRKLGLYADKALKDANKRAAEGMRTDGTRLITKQSGLKRPLVFGSFSVRYSENGVGVTISGNPTPLYLFGANPTSPMTGKTRGGVRVKVDGAKVRFSHAFVGRMGSGHVGIFERQRGIRNADNREPIKELFGLSIPQLAGKPEVQDVVLARANERFQTRFNQQADRFLKKLGAR